MVGYVIDITTPLFIFFRVLLRVHLFLLLLLVHRETQIGYLLVVVVVSK